MKLGIVAGAVLLALVVTACGSPSVSETPASSTAASPSTELARPTLTNSKLQPPPQDNQYTRTSDRPKVVFDPCTWISDDDIEAIGFSAQSRKRGADLVAEYTFLTCDFDTVDGTMGLGVDSGNITWDENLGKNGAWLDSTTVNGREAGLVQGEPGGENECSVHLRTQVGVVFVRAMRSSLGRRQNLDPCANIVEIASVVEKSIGKEN